MDRRPLELDDLYRIPFVSDPQLSPDGSLVAFVVTRADAASDENVSSIWTVPASGGGPTELTRGTRDTSPRWSPDGTRLAFVSARGGGDTPAQVWIIPVAGGEARRLTTLEDGAGDPAWSPDSTRIAFLGTVDLLGDPADDDERKQRASAPRVIRRLDFKADGMGLIGSRRRHLFVADLTSGDTRQLTSGDHSVAGIAWSPDGTRLAFTTSMDPDRDVRPSSSVYVIDAGGGDPSEVARGLFASPAWSPDGSMLVFAGRERLVAGHSRLYVASSAGGAAQEHAPGFDRNVMVGGPAYPGAPPRFSADGTEVLFCARVRGCVHVFVTPARPGGTPQKIVGGDHRVIAGLSTNGESLAFVAGLPASTGEIFVGAADGSRERQVTDLVAEALHDVELHTLEPRMFEARDGTPLHAWVVRGRADGPAPTLLDIHGGPHNSWGPAFDGVHLWHQLLAAQGWTIVCPNPRGSDGYGESFYNGVCEGWGIKDERDFLDVLDALVAEGVSDPARTAVTGYSYGGYMACWLAARTDRFSAAVPGGTVVNLASEAGTSDIGTPMSRVEHGGHVWQVPDAFREMSPITYVEGVRAPTLLLHGEDDDRCPIGQAEEWFAALRTREVPVELVRYPGGSHLFILLGRPSHRIDYCRRVADWVTAHVPAVAPAH